MENHQIIHPELSEQNSLLVDGLKEENAKSPFTNLMRLDQSDVNESRIRDLPDDFSERFANKLVLIHDGQSTRKDATFKIINFLKKHIDSPQMYQEMFRSFYILLSYDSGEQIVELILNAILLSSEGKDSFCEGLINWLADANKSNQKFLDHEFDDKKTELSREYISDSVIAFCDTILIASTARADIFDLVRKYYNNIFRIECKKYNVDMRVMEDKSFINSHFKKVEFAEKRNFFFINEMLRYFNMVSNNVFSGRLASIQVNNSRNIFNYLENQKILLLEDWVNELSKKEKIEESDFQNKRHCNSEEIDLSYKLFKYLLGEFRAELRYNPEYIMLEYMRVFLFSFNLLLGFVGGMFSILGVGSINVSQGLVIAVIMLLYSFVTQSKTMYKSFNPRDRYYEIQNNLPTLCENMKRMSFLQLTDFLEKQTEDPDNNNNFVYIPNFFGFISVAEGGKLFKFLGAEELRKVYTEINEKVTKKRWNHLRTY